MSHLPLYHLAKGWVQSEIGGLNFGEVSLTKAEKFAYFIYSYKKLGQSFLITPTLTPYSYESSVADSGRQLRAFLDILKKNYPKTYIHLVIQSSAEFKDELTDAGFEVKRKANFILDLCTDEESLKRKLSSTRRRHINKSSKELRLEWDTNRHEAFKLFKGTYEKNGLSFSESFFGALENEKATHVQILSEVYQGDVLLAANLCVLAGSTAYYLLGGTNEKVKSPHAGTYSLWSCILKAREKGVETFNFCGSSIPGIARYFKSFGATEISYLEIKKGHKKIDMIKKLKSRLSK